MAPRSPSMARSGMLIHGRHLQARGWEAMMWGGPDVTKLGTLPTAVLALLDEDPANVAVIALGSGASHNGEGASEAEMAKRLVLSRFDDLERFPAIRDHPRWLRGKAVVAGLFETAVADVVTRNTAEEIARAADTFAKHGATRVLHVTGASHGPRCQLLQNIARETGAIPASQRWRLITDDIPYPSTAAGDTLVLEEPHRGDDPMRHVARELRPAQLFRRFFTITPERQSAFLAELARLLERYL